VWEKRNGEWMLKHSVANSPENTTVALAKTDECEFVLTGSKDPQTNDEEYTLLDRGYVG